MGRYQQMSCKGGLYDTFSTVFLFVSISTLDDLSSCLASHQSMRPLHRELLFRLRPPGRIPWVKSQIVCETPG